MSESLRIFLIAGEASGDFHGSKLMISLKAIHPKIKFLGIGGAKMEKQGLDSLIPIEKMSIMGFSEILKHLPFFLKVKKKVIEQIKYHKPHIVILIDYPGFNLNIAKMIKRQTNSKIIYYICPQIWAWKENRLKILKKFINQAIVIFPFEPKWYSSRGYSVFYPGHPILDYYKKLNKKNFLESFGYSEKNPTLTLYPGSRNQEFERHFNIFLGAAKLIQKTIPNLQVLIGLSSAINKNKLKKDSLPNWVKIERQNPQYALEVANAAIIASGTSTLEAAVFETPSIVVYKMSTISWILTKLFVNVKYAAMANLIANKEVMPELLQNQATIKNISTEILKILQNSKIHNKIIKELKKIKKQLGEKGSTERSAKFILENR